MWIIAHIQEVARILKTSVQNKQRAVVVKVERPQSKPIVQPHPVMSVVTSTPTHPSNPDQTETDLKTKLKALTVDSIVFHKKFGKGTIVKINKNEKFIYVKFSLDEKNFIFPYAFLMGFLEV